jgi:hypothetical protein
MLEFFGAVVIVGILAVVGAVFLLTAVVHCAGKLFD